MNISWEPKALDTTRVDIRVVAYAAEDDKVRIAGSSTIATGHSNTGHTTVDIDLEFNMR